MSYLGGLEFATGIYINIVDPDEAAKILRGKATKVAPAEAQVRS